MACLGSKSSIDLPNKARTPLCGVIGRALVTIAAHSNALLILVRLRLSSMPKKNCKGWSVPLAHVIEIKGGPKLVTLADARAFILNRPKRQHSAQWDGAIRCLLQAAETGSATDIKQATSQIERCVLLSVKAADARNRRKGQQS
jgi:hypothetical protein